ncbi:MAG: hypothetical protein RKO66_07230 [Candidatus Contendobacter sp.]|nr:hypothetical protein [Candidatus Contendobacter sp.]MDS4059365.1 hypothetical protein [Candidatus Contendobacter sp.]
MLVHRSPNAIEDGRDEQLERAVEYLPGQLGGPALEIIDANPSPKMPVARGGSFHLYQELTQ